MKLWVFSDLHVDVTHNDWTPPPDVDRDVVVCAGDVAQPATHALRWLRKTLPTDRIIYVMGNHDRYSNGDRKAPEWAKTTFEGELVRARAVAAELGVDLLENDSVVIDGPDGEQVRFLGCTLWTDFSFRPPYTSINEAIREAEGSRGMNDYRMIKVGEGRSRDKLRARQTIEAHKESRNFLELAMTDHFDGETVVVTHHAPVAFGWPSEMDHCYRTDLSLMMDGDRAPALWVHGHIHSSYDTVVGRTRVLSNARGRPTYVMRNAPRENPHFDERLVVEVGQPKPISSYGR